MNRHRLGLSMEASQELRPPADETPGSNAHCNRFARPVSKPGKSAKNKSAAEINGEIGR
jgi:hypothetical protein